MIFPQVLSVRVMMTKDEEPKCSGLALVRFKERDFAAKALQAIPEQEVSVGVNPQGPT